MKTRIILERHGQSVGNAERIFLGHTNLGLTEEGREQAEITAEHLKDEPLAAIYSSDLKRACDTALPHAKRRGMEILTSEKLREFFVGDWEGMDVRELRENHYEEFVIRRSYRDFTYPNGESCDEVFRRMSEELLKIAAENPGKTVLVVSHAAAIRAFWYKLCNYTEENMDDRLKLMQNCAYCILDCENGRLIPRKYGISEHLPETKIHPV